MATPHVAGVVALMRSANPELDVITIKQILMDTANDLGVPGEDNIYGWGFLDAYEAVIAAMDGYGVVAGTVVDDVTGESHRRRPGRCRGQPSRATSPTSSAVSGSPCPPGRPISWFRPSDTRTSPRPIEIPAGSEIQSRVAPGSAAQRHPVGYRLQPGRRCRRRSHPRWAPSCSWPKRPWPSVTTGADGTLVHRYARPTPNTR